MHAAVVVATAASVVSQMAPGAGKGIFALLSPTSASAATRDTHDLPPLPSPRRAPRKLDIPQGDFRNLPRPTSAPPATAASGPLITETTPPTSIDLSRSTIESRSARTDTYLNPDGTHTAVLHNYESNYRDPSGHWQPIDNALTAADASHHRTTAGPVGITFADSPADPNLVRLTGVGWWLSLGIDGAASGQNQTVQDNQERYTAVLPGANLDLIALDGGVKANLVLTQAPTGAGAPHWRFPLHLSGLTATTAPDGTIAFMTATGGTALTLERGVAYDSSVDPTSGNPASTPVSAQLVQNGATQALDLSIDRAWLSAPQRVYPVTVDPTLNAGNDTSMSDAYASSACPTCNYDGGAQFDSGLQSYTDKIGYQVYSSNQDYTYIQWDLSPVTGKHILSAQLRSYFWSGSGEYDIWRVGQPWTAGGITWNTLPNHTADRAQITYGTTGTWVNADLTPWAANWASGAWPAYGVSMDTAGTNNYWVMAADEASTSQRPILVVNYNTPPPASNPVSPVGNTTLTTATPTLTTTPVTDADAGQTVSYDFRIATGSDAETGAVFNSGWITGTTYTVPAGYLQDGATYYWKVWTTDGTDNTSSAPSGSFTVNLRLGDQPSNPFDSVGPVDVNLATGNLEAKAGSPALTAVGGNIGLAYTYNSQAQPEYGLTGSYWADCSMPSPAMPPAGQPSGQRFDTATSFAWNGNAPIPFVPGTNWCARWTGYITFPYAIPAAASNAWRIGADSDDGVRVSVGGTVVLNRWYDQATTGSGEFTGSTQFGTSTANQTLAITVDYYQHCCSSFLTLYVGGPVNFQLPVSWLSPTPPTMAQGWSLTGGDNQMLAYTSATVTPQDLVLKSPNGDVHEYVQTSSGSGSANAWTPMSEGDAHVTQDASGNFIVHGEDGIVYTFNSLGKLTSAVTVVDDAHPAAAQFAWNATTDRLDTITDPVTGRTVRLTYQTDPTQQPPPSPACPTASGFDADAPTGELCLIRYSDGTQTNLYYLNSNLARIENWWSSTNQSNTEITDFGYDSTGRIVRVRTPLAADEVAAGLRTDDDSVRTVVGYDGTGRVSSVTLPAPTASTDPHPQHSYTYASSTQTDVHIAALTEPNGYARRVTFDGAGHMTSDRDTAGLATTTSWDSGDRSLTRVDPAGLETGMVYDPEHRLTDQYGPAPSSCFAGSVPNGTCTNPAVPHATTAYDEGIQGLAATYYNGVEMPSGTPAAHGTGAIDASGAVNVNWLTTPPPGITNPSASTWSARYTGEIAFPSTGAYTLWLNSDDGSRLFIDDKLVVDFWSDHGASMSTAGTFNNTVANSRHRIRIDYYETSGGGASLQLYWQPPGGSQVIVPGADLYPRYGLTTSHVDADGKKASTQYGLPELGLPTAETSDPQGLALRSTTTYESVGAGYLRELQHTLPKGSVTAVTTSYYGSSDTAPSNQCGGGVLVGLAKQETGATPASGPAIQHQYVYDSRGRILGMQVVGDVHWTCTAYDARGRVVSSTDSQGRTATFGYATPGTVTTNYTDSAGGARSTRATIDLNDNPITYVDENGTTTTTTYDQVERRTATYRKFSGQSSLQLAAWGYNTLDQLTSETDYSSGAARVTSFGYDSAGRLSTETLPNGIVRTKTYDPNLGTVSGLSHKLNGSELSPWTYTYSPAARIVQETTTNRTRAFSYDSVGRLSKTVEGGTTRNYSYDADSNRCSTSTTCDGSYAYDNADRLLSSPIGSGYSYDSHGNLLSANPTGQPGPQSLDQSPYVDASQMFYDTSIGAGAGNLSATLDWGPMPTYTTQSQTGSLTPGGGGQSYASALDAQTYATAQVTWTQGTHTVTTTPSSSVGAGGTSSQSVNATGTGALSASVDWQPTTFNGATSGSVANLGTSDTSVPVSASGTVSASLTWPSKTPNPTLDLLLLDPNGTQVASSAKLTGNAQSINYTVSGVTYPTHQTYTLRVKAVTTGSTYTLTYGSPVTANLDLQLLNPAGTVVASSSSTTAKPEQVNYTVPSGGTGSYTLQVISQDYDANYTATVSYPVLAYADVTLAVKNSSGATVASSETSTGAASLIYNVSTGATYQFAVVDNSSDLAVPSYGLSWTSTTQGTDTWSSSLGTSATASHGIAVDGQGQMSSSMNWTQGSHTVSASPSGSVPANGSTTVGIGATATGIINANVDWGSTTWTLTDSGSVGNLGTSDWPVPVSASGTISAGLSWPSKTPNPNLALYLFDQNGTQVASSTKLTGNSQSITYAVNGVSYPTRLTYTLRVKATATGSSFTLSQTSPVTATVGLQLLDPTGSAVASATSTTAKPQALSYTVPSGSTGNYSLVISSSDYPASFTSSLSYPVLAYADLTWTLLSPSGAAVTSTRSTSGSAAIGSLLTGAGTYTLQVTNNSSDLSVPSLTATSQIPRLHYANLQLSVKDANGNVVASNTSTSRPKTISTTLAQGAYTLEITPVTGVATTHLTATYQSLPPKEVISYDGNDHSTTIDDGTNTTNETLASSGRVLRRVVTNDLTHSVVEDTTMGYADGGDSPSYSEPTGGTIVTTYVSGPDGLLMTDIGGTPSYATLDLHGDLVGTTNANGVFTAAPTTDEFGVGTPPASRLGWLGGKERFATGGNLDFVRMGARLYQPSLGRFLEVDPVAGGSANDYDYVDQDPVNGLDLKGRSLCSVFGWMPIAMAFGCVSPARHKVVAILAKIRGLEHQLRIHEEKLARYIADPLAHDNDGRLRQALDKGDLIRALRIYQGRINNLRHQIENFRRQIQTETAEAMDLEMGAEEEEFRLEE